MKFNFETQTEHTFEEKILYLRNVNKEKMLTGHGHSYDGETERKREGEWELEKYQAIHVS